MKKNRLGIIAIIISVIALFFSVYDNQKSYTNNESVADFTALKSEVNELAYKVFELQFFPKLRSRASFSIGNEGFQKIETAVGNIFVSIDNVENYGNGKKITFNVGNPLAAEIINVEASLSFGQSLESYKSSEENNGEKNIFEGWEKSLRTVNKNHLTGFKPRSWNKMTFILSPAKDEDLETLRLTIAATGLSLYKDR